MQLDINSIKLFIRRNHLSLLFIGVILTSLFFLFYKINTIPFGLNNDAAWEGSAAIEILKGNYSNYIPYAAEGWRGEGIVRIITAFFMLFLGPSPLTIRLATIFFGVGIVITTYYLIKYLFDTKLALLTSFLIAISGWQITFSKSGWRAVTVPFFTSILFLLFFKGIESKKMHYFALTGIFLSVVTFYTYDAARAVPILFMIWLGIEIISTKKFFKTYFKHMIVLFASAFILSIPMLLYASNNFENFKSRSDFMFVGHRIEEAGNLNPLIENFRNTALLFNVSANGNDFFIFEPLIDAPVSFFLPIGLLITLYFIIFKKRKNYLFILIWFLASLMPGMLSIPNGNRAIGAIPPVYFICSVGILIPCQYILQKYRQKEAKYFVYLSIFLFCTVSAFVTYDNYLGKNRRELRGFYPETLIATNYIKTIWQNYNIYLTDNFPRELLTFYLYRDGTNAFDKSYNWFEFNTTFLDLDNNGAPLNQNGYNIIQTYPSNNKGFAFFMFPTPENELIANQLVDKYPNSKKFYLWYKSDNIERPATLVVISPR